MALDVTGQRLFVTNREAKSITVVDLKTNTQVAEWPVERQPTGLAFDEANQELWVTNYNDASVTVLDLVGTPLATLTVGRGPNGIAIDPDRRVAFVVQSLDKTLTVIDMNSRKRMQTVDREGGSGIAVDPVAQKACVASIFNTLYCYDSSLKLVETAPSLGDVVAVDPVTHDWVGVSISSKRLEVLDAVTRERKSFTLGQAPTGLVIDPSTRLVYVVMPGTREILVAEPFA